jgi:hypothetical protein
MTIGPLLTITLLLSSGPVAQGDEYSLAIAAVERGVLAINTDPTGGIDALRAALAELHNHAPRLAGEPAALELRTMAELALARALLANGERAAATAVVDAALEGLIGETVNLDQLGPSLAALVEERQQAIAARGYARLRVACAVPCRVYVDERSSAADQPGGASLLLGPHRVWIEGEDAEPLRTTLTLGDPDAVLTLAYPEPVAPAPTLLDAKQADRLPPPVKRAAPRWAEVSTLVIGSAAAVAGAVLFALDSKCPHGVDSNDPDACPQLYDTRTAGIALLSAGGATALLGGVLLVVDEVRLGNQRGHELALTWTTRF